MADSKDERTWAILCHLAGLLGLVIPIIGGVLGPLVIWLIKKEELPGLDAHGKEAVNFQISMLIYKAILTITVIGIFLVPVAYVVQIVCVIIATVKASDGEVYQYPLSIRFFK